MGSRSDERGPSAGLPRLVTIPFSHFCEKARWALEFTGQDYAEEGHLPIASVFASKRAGGTRTTPVMVLPEGPVIADSTEILRHADERATYEHKLWPEKFELRGEVDRWVELFDRSLGPATRRFAYGYMLPERRQSAAFLKHYSPPGQRWLAGIGYPLTSFLIKKGLNIDADSIERSRAKIDEVFDEVDAALADGREYLVADRFTAADLTLAALAAPAVFPEHDKCRMPPLDGAPDALAERARVWRERPAGRHAREMWRKHRP